MIERGRCFLQVVDVHILKHMDTGRVKGAFVEFCHSRGPSRRLDNEWAGDVRLPQNCSTHKPRQSSKPKCATNTLWVLSQGQAGHALCLARAIAKYLTLLLEVKSGLIIELRK